MTKTEQSGLRRREFVKALSAGAAVVAATGVTNACSDSADNSSLAESALSREYPSGYYKYHHAPASSVDFGLTPEQELRSAELHKTLFIFDGLQETTYFDGLYDNILAGTGAGVGGGFTIGAFPLEKVHGFTDNLELDRDDWWTRATLDNGFAFQRNQEKKHSEKLKICYNIADVRAAFAEGKIAMLLDVQNTYFMGNDETLLDHYYKEGLRRVQLTYNRTVLTGSGCMEPRDGGLTVFGKTVVERLNELNMMVDTGHSSPLTLMDAIDVSSKPICCSHAGLRSVVPGNPRSHPDKALVKLADNGGVFGVVGVPGALVGSTRCHVSDFVDNIATAVNLMGIDHVGFALDQIQAASLEEILTSPDWPKSAVAKVNVSLWPWSDGFEGLENHTGYPNLTRGLVARGFSDEDIAKIMGGNFLRLIEETIG